MTPSDQALLATVLDKDGHYDPYDIDQAERLIKAFDISITKQGDDEGKYPTSGWNVLWSYGGGLVCPPVPEEDARLIIALACYLDLVGVDVSITNRLAYWAIRGPKLTLLS